MHMDEEVAGMRRIIEQAPDQFALREQFEAWMKTFHHDADWSLLAIELALQARRDAVFARKYDKVQTAHRLALGEVISLFFSRAGKRLPAEAASMATIFKALAYGLALQDRPKQRIEGIAEPIALLRLVMASVLKAADKSGKA